MRLDTIMRLQLSHAPRLSINITIMFRCVGGLVVGSLVRSKVPSVKWRKSLLVRDRATIKPSKRHFVHQNSFPGLDYSTALVFLPFQDDAFHELESVSRTVQEAAGNILLLWLKLSRSTSFPNVRSESLCSLAAVL